MLRCDIFFQFDIFECILARIAHYCRDDDAALHYHGAVFARNFR